MSERKLVSYGAVLWIALGLLMVTGYFYWTRGVYVRITNNTQSILKHIDIAYSVGVVHIAALEPKASCGRYVNPTGGDSGLKLEWIDSSGTKQSHRIDVYLEHNYSRSVEIAVDPNNEVSWID
jgi:hypothetical protein